MTVGWGARGDAALSRRSTLGAVVATIAALATGCTDSSPDRSAGSAGASPTPSGSATPVDPDQQLAVDAMADEVRVLDRLSRTERRHPGLAEVLAGTRAVHQRHQALLARAVSDGGYPSSPGPPRVPTGPTAALRALADGQDQLAHRFRRHAEAARSGAFARVLASMAAAADQQGVRLSAAVDQSAAHR